MNKLFKLMTVLVALLFWISCNSGVSDPSSYIELMKNQRLSFFSPEATIGEVFNTVSKGKVEWKAGPMPENDSEYRYRNIHKTSVLVEAGWQINVDESNLFGRAILGKEVNIEFQFAVKKDKSEFELYRSVINGEYQNNEETIKTAQSVGAEYFNILQVIDAEKLKIEEEKLKVELTPQIEFIKKMYSTTYNDTQENIFNTICTDGKAEWTAKRFQDNSPEYLNKKLYIVTVTISIPAWFGIRRVSLSFYAGEDWSKIEGKNIKQGGIYNINAGIIDPLNPNDIEKAKELAAQMMKIYEEKTGKVINKPNPTVEDPDIRKVEDEKRLAQASVNKAKEEDFLKENARKPGMQTTASGLQYLVISTGTGPLPKITDTIKVHYRGTLLDGTEFDSSYKRNAPDVFPLNGVIKGWIEALQLMKVGSKWQIFLPSSLAYGEKGAGQVISPNATLIFDVELLGIEKTEAAAPKK